ncbi:hypothetical protein U9M48_036852 [Paspalum notatum var. saurae]|uniref:Rapid alkalinization factor 1 n=1 Tax=Paspalum notatum var. saurae TaxID=547442 RepID=A0AAQ3UI18_PASNO
MARLALAVLLLLAVGACASAAAGGGMDLDHLGFLSAAGAGFKRECRGTVAECLAEAEEAAELGSGSADSHRRALYGRAYISYGALRRDNVPCSRRGASYYNCRPGAQANPYHRGCSRITRCRG